MNDWRQVMSKTFKAELLKDLDPVQLTVKEVRPEEVGQNKEVKLVAIFLEDPKKLVLNQTKCQQLSDATKSYAPADWTGAKVELSYDGAVQRPDGTKGGVGMRVL